ncbi:hypothetical protein DFH06DRAFT_544304 [Mycena polygramma]|nr:hypothetical protein DFH06DRAFT_544304 [Mycena polygramma]
MMTVLLPLTTVTQQFTVVPFSDIFSSTDLQSKGQLASLSWQDSTSGPKSAPTWTSICKIFGEVRGTGTGPLKRTARDAAANQAMKSLTEETG